MADQWDELFGPGAAPTQQATGAGSSSVAPKQETAKRKPTATNPNPKPNAVPETTDDDDFDSFFGVEEGDPDDKPGDASTTAQARETLAGILTEEKKEAAPIAAEAPKKRRGRPAGSKNADKPLTADEFVEKMKPENAEGNRTPEETFRPELGATQPAGATSSEQAVADAIATLARFIASTIRAGV